MGEFFRALHQHVHSLSLAASNQTVANPPVHVTRLASPNVRLRDAGWVNGTTTMGPERTYHCRSSRPVGP